MNSNTFNSILGLSLGIAVTGVSLLLGAEFEALQIVFLPIALLLAIALVGRPEYCAYFLIVFSFLDGFSEKFFGILPVSPYKVFTIFAFSSILINSHKLRRHIECLLKTPTFLLFFSFFLCFIVSLVLSENRSNAIDWGSRLFGIMLLFPIVSICLYKKEFVEIGIMLLAVSSGISGVVLVLDMILGTSLISTTEAATTARTAEGINRSSGGSQSNPTTAATMLITGAFVSIILVLEKHKNWRFFSVIAAISIIAVAASLARSASLVLIFLLFVVFLFYARRSYSSSIVVILACFAFLLSPLVPIEYFERLVSIFSGGDWTLGRRLTYHIVGVDLLLSNPVFGIGPGNFYEFFLLSEYRFLPGRTLGGRQLHNMYLSVFVEYGLVGGLAFVAFLASAFRVIVCSYALSINALSSKFLVALIFSFTAFYLSSAFVPNEYNKYTWLLPALAISYADANKRKPMV